MLKTVTPTVPPPPNIFTDSVERGLDPWHPDAFRGTPAEGAFLNPDNEPRKAGWYYIDWCGNVVGFVADGTPMEFPE